jgi:hypothetical protein
VNLLTYSAQPARWFVTTFQFYSISTNLASLVAKGGLPRISPSALVLSLDALVAGLALGGALFTMVKEVLS